MKYALSLIGLIFVGCAAEPPAPTPPPTAIEQKPLFQMSPREVDAMLRDQGPPASLPDRVVEIGRLNLGQPYELYLLGEAPFETIDPQLIYNLQKSDCVVFLEHALAMSLANDFPTFLRMLQRIRYTDGQIGVRTRNHYTEADWNVHNGWLVEEITDTIAEGKVQRYTQRVDRQRFFKSRYKIDVPLSPQTIEQTYIANDDIALIKSKLRTGDLFNSVKGGAKDAGAWVHHVGFVTVRDDGEVYILHSNTPVVLEQPIDEYIANARAREARQAATTRPATTIHKGFKFLRLRPDALAQLRAIDGTETPRVAVPADAQTSFDTFAEGILASEPGQLAPTATPTVR